MPDIHHSINVSAPAGIVEALVSTPEGFRQWWAEDVEPLADGVVSLGFFNRDTVYRLRPLAPNAGRTDWRCETGNEWQGTDLRFAIEPQGSGIRLDCRHANWRENSPFFVSCNTTWGGLMFRIKAAAEGHPQGPLFQKNALAY